MYFSSTSKNISISTDSDNETYLNATCQTKDGRWVDSSIHLDPLIGYRKEYGCLSIVWIQEMGVPFRLREQMKPETVKLVGNSLLTGTLTDDLGGHDTSLCLDFCFSNNDGKLGFDGLPRDIRPRMVKLTLKDGEVLLRGLVLRADGRLNYAELDLGDHYENDDGYLKQKKDGEFFMTARSWYINGRFELVTDMKYWSLGGGYRKANYPLYKDIKVGDEGNIWIDDPIDHGFFSLEGAFMRFLEKIPVLGYYIAEIDLLEGDVDESVRAMKECTYSTIVLAASIAGATLGGPLGAALGTAISTLVAPYVQEVFPATAVQRVDRKKVTALSIFNVLTSEVLVIAGMGIGEISSAFGQLLTEELTEQGFGSLFTAMASWLGKKALSEMTKEDLKFVVDTIIYAIENGLGEDYIRSQFPDLDPARPYDEPDDYPDVLPWPTPAGGENRPGHIPVGRI